MPKLSDIATAFVNFLYLSIFIVSVIFLLFTYCKSCSIFDVNLSFEKHWWFFFMLPVVVCCDLIVKYLISLVGKKGEN
ncbi:hypothetical protein DES40_1205 [Litorimonas taeanensis]|uniref:Uncharacterized protein n=1 Tax=Litorimonas taeanensis TaxID=568099 RepID=A0A420WLH3_9PROT|nr:hypothetical protein DES40_1205 [Litorimonas taeanensis]